MDWEVGACSCQIEHIRYIDLFLVLFILILILCFTFIFLK